jgi:hypothetical protein
MTFAASVLHMDKGGRQKPMNVVGQRSTPIVRRVEDSNWTGIHEGWMSCGGVTMTVRNRIPYSTRQGRPPTNGCQEMRGS